jgi:hypothetical protein
VQLGPPLILYLQATALVTSSPQSVGSWRARYYAVRRRFFGLNFFFGFAIEFANRVAAGPEAEWITPSIATAVGVAALSTVGFVSDSHRLHSAFALIMVPGNVWFAAYVIGGLNV